jgi:hypothetical protein
MLYINETSVQGPCPNVELNQNENVENKGRKSDAAHKQILNKM